MPRTTRGLHITFSSFHLSWSFPSDHRLNNPPRWHRILKSRSAFGLYCRAALFNGGGGGCGGRGFVSKKRGACFGRAPPLPGPEAMFGRVSAGVGGVVVA